MKKFLDIVYVFVFGKHTRDGFVNSDTSFKKHDYIFDSVFPNEEVFKIAMSDTVSSSVPKQ